MIIPDIKNYAKKAFYLRYPKKLFWISKITISDIRKYTFISDIKNCYFGYPKLVISDIWNFFRYLKFMCQYFRYHKFFFGYQE